MLLATEPFSLPAASRVVLVGLEVDSVAEDFVQWLLCMLTYHIEAYLYLQLAYKVRHANKYIMNYVSRLTKKINILISKLNVTLAGYLES
jgi:hypothetical protein